MEKVLTLKRELAISKSELIAGVVLYAAAFLVPFLIGQPQLLVGSVVNATLVFGAIRLKSYYKLLPLIVLPSFAVLSRGLIFGPYTILLVYTIPFIWVANSLLVLSIQFLTKHTKLDKIIAVGSSAVIKFLFLYACAIILVNFSILPKPFLVSFGIFQLYTALIGGGIALAFTKLIKK